MRREVLQEIRRALARRPDQVDEHEVRLRRLHAQLLEIREPLREPVTGQLSDVASDEIGIGIGFGLRGPFVTRTRIRGSRDLFEFDLAQPLERVAP